MIARRLPHGASPDGVQAEPLPHARLEALHGLDLRLRKFGQPVPNGTRVGQRSGRDGADQHDAEEAVDRAQRGRADRLDDMGQVQFVR